MTADDLAGGNRLYDGEYSVGLAEGQSRYKDSLELVYTPVRIDGDRRSDVSRTAWGVEADGQLYINIRVLNGKKGYLKSFSPGRYNLFFAQIKEDNLARRKFSYEEDDVRYYKKETGGSRGSMSVGGIPIDFGNSTLVTLPIVVDRTTGEMRAFSQAYMEELSARHPGVEPVPMNEARDARLIEYFKQLNRSN